jgi:SulP family sulfate permease
VTGLAKKFFGNVRGDVFGGVIAGIVALPLALGFGVASGMGAAAGLYGAIGVGIVAAASGGTPAQVSGPTGPMTVVVAGVAAAQSGRPEIVFTVVLLGGLFELLMGVLRLGQYVRYIPYPVISGFMSGVGVIVICLQSLPLIGLPGSGSVRESLQTLWSIVAGGGAAGRQPSATALTVGLATLALVYLVPRVLAAVPGTLSSLVLMTAVSTALGLDIPRIGEIPHGLPSLHLPILDPATLVPLIPASLTLAGLAAIDSLLTSVIHDNVTRTRHESDRELIGQGLGNMAAGLIWGLPGAGATMRTVVNIQAGGRGPLSGVVHGLLLLALLVGLGPLASHIPLAVLAGILVTVGVGILDYKGLKHFTRVPRSDAVIMVITLVLTVFVDLIQAVLVGLVLSCLVIVKRLSDVEVGVHEPLSAASGRWMEGLDVPHRVRRDVYILNVHGALFFGHATPIVRLAERLTGARAVIVRLRRVHFLDQSAAYALSDLAIALRDLGVEVWLCGIPDQPRRVLELLGIAPGDIPADRIRWTDREAVEAAVRMLTERTAGTAPAPTDGVDAGAASATASATSRSGSGDKS